MQSCQRRQTILYAPLPACGTSIQPRPTWIAPWSGTPECRRPGPELEKMLLEYEDGKAHSEGWPKPTFGPTQPQKAGPIGPIRPNQAAGGSRDLPGVRLYSQQLTF